jgi:glycosyltransferase involved in cell wall biosynthesis
LGLRDDVEVTLFHGNAKRGIGAPTERADLTGVGIASRPIKNWFWPFGGHRVAWQSGALKSISRRYDVVVVPEIVHNLTVWLIVLARSLLGRPVAVFGYGYRPASTSLGSRLKNAARVFLMKRADAILSYTDRGSRECLSQGLDPSRLFALQNTVDTEHLRQLSASIDPSQTREVHDQYSPGLVIVFLGRLVQEKHADVLIGAYSTLRSRRADAALLIIGDGPHRDTLVRRASGLAGVHFLGAIYDEKELARLLLASDVLVIPGRIGLTCAHGFAYSLPAITTSETVVEQSPEYDYLQDGINCLILQALDVNLYARALERLAGDRTELDRLRQGAGRSGDTLTMSHMADEWVRGISSAHRRHR